MAHEDAHKYSLYDKQYKIKNNDKVGILVDVQYRDDRKEYLYIMETKDNELIDVWEKDIVLDDIKTYKLYEKVKILENDATGTIVDIEEKDGTIYYCIEYDDEYKHLDKDMGIVYLTEKDIVKI